MQFFGAGFAAGIGAGIAIGISVGKRQAQTTLRQHFALNGISIHDLQGRKLDIDGVLAQALPCEDIQGAGPKKALFIIGLLLATALAGLAAYFLF